VLADLMNIINSVGMRAELSVGVIADLLDGVIQENPGFPKA
jgi:hypothetical protein